MITAKILTDSINPKGRRITSWLLEYNRFIHSEFMTHRDFSRNAGSSRAIPFKAMSEEILKRPALPVWWGGHQKGMSSGLELEGKDLMCVKEDSLVAMNGCFSRAKFADKQGLHKSITNRWMEPWAHIKVVATITDMRNFFALRAHPAAQPEFQVLAYRMLELYLASNPNPVRWGDWHIPFEAGFNIDPLLSIWDRLKVATARCCWVSYNKPEKEIGTQCTIGDAFTRHDESARMGHWSPFEHCAQAINDSDDENHGIFGKEYPWSNFDTGGTCSGWGQYRKSFTQERKTEVDLQAIMAQRPKWTIDAGKI